LAKKKSARKTSGARSSKKRSKTSPSTKKTKKSAKTSKKVAGKKASRKVATSKKKTSKKAATKTSRKKTSKKTKKTTAPSKPLRRKVVTKKKTTTKETQQKGQEKAGDKKSGRKGITIVSQKPAKRSSSTPTQITIPKFGSGILGPGAPKRKPLIPSGPSPSDKADAGAEGEQRLKKSPFKKRELNRFREILLRKRAELIGDVSTMENEALRSEFGGTSHLPQHMAEQGSDTYDQAISLDLAAADRQLIKEIDEALRRIAEGTYGICELTGRPIRADRLEELPWARYSIDAARELERRKT